MKKKIIIKSLSFVGGVLVVTEKIEHFSHSGAEPVSVDGFYFCCRKIGGEVCDKSFFFEQVIACEEDFCHYIAIVAEIFGGGFCAKIVETIDSWRSDFVI